VARRHQARAEEGLEVLGATIDAAPCWNNGSHLIVANRIARSRRARLSTRPPVVETAPWRRRRRPAPAP